LALADLDAGMAHPFGEPTKYELVHDVKRYAPKAVVGLAYRHLTGEILPPDQFSGGEAPGQANFVLRTLGLVVVPKGDAVPPEDTTPGRKDWSEAEVALVVADYFAMLEKELRGESYSKVGHNAALRPLLAGRSKPSVEFKHANISAVLVRLGLPYIRGYKPRSNYQELLAVGVEVYLAANPGYLGLMAGSPVVDPPTRPSAPTDPDSAFDDPPEEVILPEPGKPWVIRRVTRHIDFAERDARNRRLGRMGEEFVVELERHRLDRAGRPDLAKRVDWVSESVGDGLGFDVESFDTTDDSPLRIEVKTTGLGKYHPFLVTENEVRCSEDEPARYHLYRVFEFSSGPWVYVVQGSLRDRCRLQPVVYRAGL
jgi:hypothetical protein